MQDLRRRTELEKNFINHKIGWMRSEQHQVIQNWYKAQRTEIICLKSPRR